MKVGVRESLREANTLYRHPNQSFGRGLFLEPLTFTVRSVGVYGVRKEGYCNVGILFLGFPVLSLLQS